MAVHPLVHMITGFINILFSILGACYKVDNIGRLTTSVAPKLFSWRIPNIWLATKNVLFFTSDVYNNHNLWPCQKVCDALVYLLDNIFITFGTKLYRQTIGIPMGTNCAPLVADLFLFCYERDFMKSLSRENQADIIEAFNSTSRYLDDLLNIDNIYFDQMVDRVYPTELQLNRANSSDTEAPFLDLNLCISNGAVSTKIYDKRRF